MAALNYHPESDLDYVLRRGLAYQSTLKSTPYPIPLPLQIAHASLESLTSSIAGFSTIYKSENSISETSLMAQHLLVVTGWTSNIAKSNRVSKKG